MAHLKDLIVTGATRFLQSTSIAGNLTVSGNITGSAVYNAVWNADYAEGFDYEGDLPEVGRIVELCGNNKIKVASANSNKVIGVVSDTYWVLAGCRLDEVEDGSKTAIGLVGQLPIKVVGKVEYGDFIKCIGDGIGIVDNDATRGQIVGRAMESNSDENIKDVRCLVQVQ